MKKVISGMYAWGGPGTIRLLETKYHQPHIDTNSFLTMYDRDRLAQAQKKIGVSDVWVTFSWGFSDQTEREDYEFIIQRLPTFKQLKLRTHAYIQGLNVVTSEFEQHQIFCQDIYGRRIPYSRGRSLTCPCNPQAVRIITQRIKRACQADFDGIFVDNIIFGAPPSFFKSNSAPFFGCYCQYCQTTFLNQFGYPLPTQFNTATMIKDYLRFRSTIMSKLISKLSKLSHHYGKTFGVNLFDPLQINSVVYQGYDLSAIESELDYFFIENHSLPSRHRHNQHLQKLLNQSDKPVVVISYDQGIGFEPAYTTTDYAAIKAEATQLGYVPCYKVSEFTTHGQWHTLDFESIQTLTSTPLSPAPSTRAPLVSPPLQSVPARAWFDVFLARLSNYWLVPAMTLYFENRYVSYLARFVYKRQLHLWKNFEVEFTLHVD